MTESATITIITRARDAARDDVKYHEECLAEARERLAQAETALTQYRSGAGS